MLLVLHTRKRQPRGQTVKPGQDHPKSPKKFPETRIFPPKKRPRQFQFRNGEPQNEPLRPGLQPLSLQVVSFLFQRLEKTGTRLDWGRRIECGEKEAEPMATRGCGDLGQSRETIG